MESHSSQYDDSIGGHVELPDTENTFQYAEKRLPELASLINTVKNPTKSKLIFQSMPRHMRRRTAAQNPKRLPVRLRQGHISQLRKSGTPAEKKRPSRKYRRRAGNLRKEYSRRQGRTSWLETHIWHAKRFHMVRKWGFKIPWASCDKSFRACYRAVMKHCLIQDVSYLRCLEIRGCEEELQQLKRLCSPTELSFVAKSFLSGQREGTVGVFERDKYPFGAIGQVSFFWKPPEEEKSRCLWMFIHPLCFEAIKRELKELFSLESAADAEMEENTSQKDLPTLRSASGSVQINELRINRFRLTGPLSHSVLSHALKCKVTPQIDREFNQEAHERQMKYWREISNLSSPAELPSNMILALNVEDPRVNRPQKRSKALPEGGNTLPSTTLRIPPLISSSPLWDADLRRKIPQNMMNTEKYNEKRRKECLVPGERCSFEDTLQALPLLLIQRPGNFATGWDVIVPEGYGVVMWISLIMWGARAGGWRETVSMLREQGKEPFAPDTEARKTEDASLAEELREKYFRKPAKKRPNYRKLSIASPFQCPWKKLIDEMSGSDWESFYVLRDRKALEQCEKALKYQVGLDAITIDGCALIPLHLRMISRGNPGNFSLIAVPTDSELKKKQSGERGPLHTEPLAKDPHQKVRNSLRLKHRRFLNQQRRLRVRIKRKQQEKSTERVKIPRERSQLVTMACYKFKEQIQKLWLPQKPPSIRHQCSRLVIGYVTQSDFSFTDSTVTAIGYVTWSGFRRLINACRKWKQVTLLVRGTKTRQYRGASVSITYNP